MVSGVLLILAVWLGGTRGWFGDRLIQAGSALLLALTALHIGLRRDGAARLPPQVWWFGALLVIVPALAWLGLSGPIAGDSPGALQLRTDLVAAGLEHASRPIAAEQVLWSIFPPLAILFAASLAGIRGRSTLLALCVGLAIAQGLLGMSQLAERGFGWVRFMWPGDVEVYLGTFANRNHLACLSAAMLPLCIAQAVVRIDVQQPNIRVLQRAMWASAALLLFSGIVASRSRSGMALAFLATGGTLVTLLARKARIRALLAIAAVVGIWLALGGWRLVEGSVARVYDPAVSDSRLTYWANSLGLAREFGPGGIGLGNFQRLYGAHVGDAGLAPAAVNHVHNDWAEFALETGWIGVLALLAATIVFLRVGRRLMRDWRQDRGGSNSLWPLAAWLGASVIALHSMVDFPLRTTAVSCVFALLLAVAFASQSSSVSTRTSANGTGEGNPRNATSHRNRP